MYLIHSSKI